MRFLILLTVLFSFSGCAYYFGNTWQNSFKKIENTTYPNFKSNPERVNDELLQKHPLVINWANKELIRPTKKDQRGPERLLLAKLIARKDVELVNNYLLASIPWGNSGTSGALNPKGDYDFTSIILAAILHRFSSDSTVLWNKTEEHLARNLLIEQGGKPHTKTPRTMRIMKDTENHILMTNISQYLKNQWLVSQGEPDVEFDNVKNGLEQFLFENLEELHSTGQYEFNSKPYEGYTISALLVLYSYANSNRLKQKAKEVLDSWAWEYMLTSSNFRKSAPFRRRMGRFNSTSLTDNASSSIMKTWYLEHENGNFELRDIPHNHHQALSALVYDYRPPEEIWNLNFPEQLVFFGHGKGSSPEIHSRGEGFLLSAGGFHRGEPSQLVARPIVLMLDDGETDHQRCFHINGKGKWQSWNNTGVHHRLAIGEQPVQIPDQYTAIDSIGNWKLFEPVSGVRVVTCSEKDFGLIYLPKETQSLKQLVELNPNPTSGKVVLSEGTEIEFNLKAAKGNYVVSKVNGNAMEVRTDFWKRIEVKPQ
jgi:hypothetical protein